MRSDLSERPERPPRALVMVTGEDLPNGQSILARILPVHFEPGLVNTTILSEVQAQQNRLPHAMAGYILWLQPRLEKLGDQLHERFVARRAEFQDGQTHLRTPETLAHLILGFELFLEFAVEVGVVGKRDAGHMLQEAVAVFRQLGDVQGDVVGDEDPAEKFMATLRTLIAQGKIEIVADLKQDLLPYGGVQQIGWRDEEAAYLLPQATYSAGFGAMRAAGTSLPLKESTLWARLRTIGVLRPGDEGHATCKKMCGKGRPRVIVMSLKALGLDGSGDGPPDEPPVPPVSGKGEERAKEQGAKDGGSRREGQNPGQGGEKSGRGTAESGRGGGARRGEGRKINYLPPLSLPPAPVPRLKGKAHT